MTVWDLIKRASNEKMWRRGEDLKDQVFSVYQDEHEWEFLVLDGQEKHEVYIGLDAKEWDCSCGSKNNPCQHISATAIAALSNRIKEEREMKQHPRVGYRLEKVPRGLSLNRIIVNSAESISGSIFRRTDIDIRECDRVIETKFYMRFGKVISKVELKEFLKITSSIADISFTVDGKKLMPSAELAMPLGIVEDVGEDFRVRLIRDPKIAEVYGNIAVRYGEELRVIGMGGLTKEQYQTLLGGLVYNHDEVKSLVVKIIPELKKRIPVEIRTDRLPTSMKSKPYLRIESEKVDNHLFLHPKIVYGDPPIAEIMGDNIKFLKGEVPIRDKREEQRIIKEATTRLTIPIGVRTQFQSESAVRFASKIREEALHNDNWKIIGRDLESFKQAPAFEPRIELESDFLEVDFGPAEADSVFEAWRNNMKLVPLKEGGWAPLPTSWLNEYGHIVADLLSAKKAAGGKIPKFALFDLARLCDKLDKPAPDLDSLRALVNDFDGIKVIKPPTDLKATLREYQQVGVSWLHFLKSVEIGGILADDMGLGKTIQALCILEKRSLVIAPTSVLHNWQAEANRFRPSLRVCMYHGTNRKYDKDADILLTSYAILRNDILKLCREEWSVVVLDEAQAIKNPNSQTAQAAFQLRAKFRLTLTGTPIENRLEELWSQMHFLCPGFLSGIRNFRKQYETPIANGDAQVAARLRDRIKPFVLRRLKSEVAKELPPRTSITLKCTLNKEERTIYDAVRASTQKELVRALGEGKSLSVMTALEALLRLRQAACHSGLLPNQMADTSSKIELLLEQLTQLVAAGHKVLVFSQWTKMLDRIEPHLEKNQIGFVRLDGTTRDRAGVVTTFQSDGGPNIFLASLKAGGTGLNLTAADHVFLMDPWWNPAVEDQAADRAHRIGQDKPVNVYRIVSENTVEEKVIVLQERKRQIVSAALGNASQAAKVTKEELLSLLL